MCPVLGKTKHTKRRGVFLTDPHIRIPGEPTNKNTEVSGNNNIITDLMTKKDKRTRAFPGALASANGNKPMHIHRQKRRHDPVLRRCIGALQEDYVAVRNRKKVPIYYRKYVHDRSVQ